jgi:toxin ParE1/3/4
MNDANARAQAQDSRFAIAQTDIDKIWEHVARDSIPNADRFVDRIERRFALLAHNPRLGSHATIFDPACGALPTGATSSTIVAFRAASR